MAERGVNKAIIVGNLGDDPIVRYSPRTVFANFSVATSETWKDKNTGEKRERTDWHNIVIQGNLAEVAGEYLKKGSQIYVEGSLQTRKWTDQSGQDRYTTEVVVNIGGSMQMLGGNGGNNQAGGQKQQQQSQSCGQNELKPQRDDWAKEPPIDFDDDIPFAPIGLPYPRHAIYVI